MTIDSENILNSILSSLERIDYIKPTEIPNIDLYMDQVTTFMEEHLIYIYYYKSILSIGDIQSLLEPLTQRYFHKDGEMNMQSIYEEVFSLEKEQVEKMKQDVTEKYETASRIFPEAEAEDQEFLRIFSFICLLSFDVYVKKQVIEKLIDELPKES